MEISLPQLLAKRARWAMMASSYSLKEVETMHKMYLDNPCLEVVRKLAVLFNRPQKSIISKLSKEGIYLKKGYTTKLGKTPITKLQLLYKIEAALDVKLPGLDKTPKSTLVALEKVATDMSQILEEGFLTVDRQAELVAIRVQMKDVKK